MNIIKTELPGLLIIDPKLYRDDRGYFLETWHRSRYAEAGLSADFLQDNVSVSAPGVLRGLHLQAPGAQAKLVSVLDGAIFDVAVDVREGSPTFGRWLGVDLTADGHRQFFIPPGFAHGFVVTSKTRAMVTYKVDAPYAPGDELTIAWDDPDVGVRWPVSTPTLSAKDRQGVRLRDLPPGRLPRFRADS